MFRRSPIAEVPSGDWITMQGLVARIVQIVVDVAGHGDSVATPLRIWRRSAARRHRDGSVGALLSTASTPCLLTLAFPGWQRVSKALTHKWPGGASSPSFSPLPFRVPSSAVPVYTWRNFR